MQWSLWIYSNHCVTYYKHCYAGYSVTCCVNWCNYWWDNCVTCSDHSGHNTIIAWHTVNITVIIVWHAVIIAWHTVIIAWHSGLIAVIIAWPSMIKILTAGASHAWNVRIRCSISSIILQTRPQPSIRDEANVVQQCYSCASLCVNGTGVLGWNY